MLRIKNHYEEMQIKTEWDAISYLPVASADEHVVLLETSFIAGRNVKWYSHMENN